MPIDTTTTLSGFPDAASTGVRDGVQLTQVGNLTVTTPNAVISGLEIHGTLRIQAPGVTVVDCKIVGNGFSSIVIPDPYSATVEHCDVIGGKNGISGTGTFRHNDLSENENGINVYGPSLIEHNYIHDMAGSGSPHYDGIEINGGGGTTIRHNTIINDHDQTAAVMINNEFGGVDGIIIDGNYLAGGGYTIYSDGRFNSQPITGVEITDNVLGRGYWGYFAFWDNNPVVTNNTEIGRNWPVPVSDGDDTFNVDGVDSLFDTFDGGAGFDEIVNVSANAAVRISNLGPADSIEQISTTNGIPLIMSSNFADSLDFTGVTLVGIDRIVGANGNDTIIGSAGGESVYGNDGDDILDGAGGDDYVIGSAGNDIVIGGEGNDIVRGFTGTDTVLGGNGNDVIVTDGAANQFDIIDGGAGVDTLRNGTVSGVIVLDSFDPSNNVERVNGIGTDGNAHEVRGNANANVLDFSGVEFFNVLHVLGLDGNDTITGTDGGELILGGSGDDTIAGGGGDDEIRGNTGIDTASWSGNFADYLISFTGSAYTVQDAVASRDGTDLVRQTEFFQFADGTYMTNSSGGLTLVLPASPADFDDSAGIMAAATFDDLGVL